MESFKGVMVGATNFRDNLNQAIMSRFAFKLQLDYLDEAGKRNFFERMFKTRLSDEESARLAEVCNLAPGDFTSGQCGSPCTILAGMSPTFSGLRL